MSQSLRLSPVLLVLVAALPRTSAGAGYVPPPPPGPPEVNFCSGEYADDLSVLSQRAREFERQPQGYTYCVRNTALYECVSYGADGNLRKTRRKAVSHGTAFAYKKQNGETLLLTNQHVSEWPAVTDDDHPVSDVPAGCKRVSETLKIVENESDAYDQDDVPLAEVVADPALDMAVLKAHAELAVMPWKIGRSAALRERNVVDVRGFPLGAFKATNVGKVISAYDHDDYKDWDHDDFVIDALLSPGNSGSPVLAVSCKTGEFELVGVYHAGYTGGSALNVVVGIDQIRGMMTTLKRTPRERPATDVAAALDAKARATLAQGSPPYAEPFFPFGSLVAMVRPRDDGALVFEVLNKEFPLKTFPVLVVEDLPPREPGEFGTLGRAWFGSRQGLKSYVRSDLDGDTQGQVSHLLDALRRDALASFNYRAALRQGTRTREEFDHVARLERALHKASSAHQDLSQNASDLADRLAPHSTETGVSVADAFVPAPAQAPVLFGPPAPTAPVVPVIAPETPSAPPESSPSTARRTRPRPLVVGTPQ